MKEIVETYAVLLAVSGPVVAWAYLVIVGWVIYF